MTITILCPNGHKLVCPDDRAGKGGKCPHCGAKFRVPELTGAAPPPMPGGSGSIPPLGGDPAASGSGPLASAAVAVAETKPENPVRVYDEDRDGAPADDEIVFLCPNDHHLRASDVLMGQPGVCPVCNVEFLLPSPEDLVETEEVVEEEPSAGFNPLMFSFDAEAPVAVDESPRPSSGVGKLFRRFWSYRKQGAIVELHLSDARVLIPDGFVPQSADQSHGLFVVRETNGTHTISAVDWQSVARVAVRGLRELPGDFKFDLT